MSRTRRYLGWSRCPRHPDEGRTILVTNDHELEEWCGFCGNETEEPVYTDAEYSTIYAEATADSYDSVFGDLRRDTQ